MTSTFCTPIYRNKYYVSQPDKPIYIEIIDAIIKQNIKLQNNKGYILTLYINEDTKKELENVDNNAKNNLIEENKNWFKNNLDIAEIAELFKSSHCSQNNILHIYLTDKSIIEYDNKVIDQDSVITILTDKKIFEQCVINIKIQNLGMYIYPTHTINKWGVKHMKIYKVENEQLEITEKNEIELFWKEQLEHCKKLLEEKEEKIKEQRENLDKLYFSIINEKSQNKEWESKFADFIKKIQNIIF